jgi:hypothetical protein
MLQPIDKATFQYLMDFYTLDRLPIYCENYHIGYVTRDLRYIKGQLRYVRSESYAITLAFQQIEGVIDLIKRLKENATITIVKVEERDTWEYDDGSGYVSHHVYPKTIKTTHEHEHQGTLDSLFEKFYNMNRTYRYCNGDWFEFKDEGLRHDYSVWLDLISHQRSFDLYYGDGIVD